MSLSRIFKDKQHNEPPKCEHHSIVATTLPRMGRCIECGALVPTPFSLHSSSPKGI